MKSASHLWNQISAAEHNQIVSDFKELHAKEAAAGGATSSNLNVDVSTLPHRLGDSELPVSRAQVSPLCQRGTMKSKAQV